MRGEKRIFTKEEEQYIVDNWGKESIHSMKKKFSCTWYAVAKIGEKHGLELPESDYWTKEEVETLKELSKEYHYTIIADIMGRSENAIYLKAKKLGITLIQDRRKWTTEEETILSDSWGNTKIETIAKNLKRSVFSLKVKAVRMNLGPMIRNNYDVITISDIEDLLDVTRDRIMRWKDYGFELKETKLTKNKSYYTITWEKLLMFLENNQDNRKNNNKNRKNKFRNGSKWGSFKTPRKLGARIL